VALTDVDDRIAIARTGKNVDEHTNIAPERAAGRGQARPTDR
jgi:hypothetical protein